MKKTQKEFEQEVFDVVGREYTVLGTYKNGKTKLLMRHNCDSCNNHEWQVIPKNFLSNGTRCPICAGNQKITDKDFKQRVYNLVKDEFSVLGNYKNSNTKILIRHNCNKCNNFEWEIRPSDFLRSPNCLKCSGRMKKTTEIFKQEVYDLVGNEYSVIEEYKNAKTKILIRHNCKNCNNYEWKTKPNTFLNGNRCPKCSGLQTKTQEEFKQEVLDAVGSEYTVLGIYKNSDTKILMRHNCENCSNYEWEVIPKNFIHNQTRCPECFGSKKRTTEEFKQEVYDLVGNEYTVLEEYINANTKIKIRHNCSKCNNYEYEISPHDFLRGRRCPKCFGTPKKTLEQFKQEVFDLVKNEYSVLGDYNNSHTKILMRHNCKKCDNYEYEVRPYVFLNGCRCPKCFGNHKITNQEFLEEVNKLYPNNDYTFLEDFKNFSTKIKVRHNCKNCNNYEYKVAPDLFLKGVRCPECFGTKLKTTEQFKKEVYDLVSDEYTVLEEYIGANTKIKIRHNCSECNNYEYDVLPVGFLGGSRCPKCAGTKKLTNDEFLEKVKIIDPREDYTFLENYKNGNTKIKVRHNCNRCNNYEYMITPYRFLRGEGCPKCKISKGENQITKILDKLNQEYTVQYTISNCKYKSVLPFDIAILKDKELLAVIEFDGEQHFKPIKHFGGKNHFEVVKIRDSIKTKYCEDNNIPLLRIKYTQFDDIETILKDFLSEPNKYIKNHSYGMTNDEYYIELTEQVKKS